MDPQKVFRWRQLLRLHLLLLLQLLQLLMICCAACCCIFSVGSWVWLISMIVTSSKCCVMISRLSRPDPARSSPAPAACPVYA